MNVAFVLPHLALRFGGVPLMVRSTGAELSKKGVNVSYWCTAQDKDKGEINSIKNAYGFPLTYPRTWLRSKGLYEAIMKKAEEIDILHANDFWAHPTYAASKVGKKHNIPIIIRPAGAFEPWRLHNTVAKWVKKKAYMLILGKKILKYAACVHAVSEQEADNCRKIGYKGPITVIPNGINSEELIPGEGSLVDETWPECRERIVVLFMSRLSKEKGLDILLEVWNKLKQNSLIKESVLIIAGPDELNNAEKIKKYIRVNDIRNVILPGMVYGNLKLALYQRADLFVLPSYSENFGIVIPEAIACGTPVITTTGTPWEEVQINGLGHWINPNVKELSESLVGLLALGKDKLAKMGLDGREYIIKKYTWGATARKLIKVYNCIINNEEIPYLPE